MAALLAVAQAWKFGQALPAFPRGLLLVANVGEEGEGNLLGMRHLCKQSPSARKIESFVVVDGADTEPHYQPRTGQPALRSGLYRGGRPQLERLRRGQPGACLCRAVALFSETRLDAGPPKSAINVGLIEGGSGINAIAQAARAKVDIRSETNDKVDELAEALLAAVDRARELENQRATGGKVAVKVKEIGSRPAAALPDNAPYPAICARGGRAPGHPFAPGHLLDRRQHSAVVGDSGHLDRRRRRGRRRAYHPGVVPAGGPRPGLEAHPAHPAAADA